MSVIARCREDLGAALGATGTIHLDRSVGAMSESDRASGERLLASMYGELRALAGALFRDQPIGHTLQPTALVNEVYLKLGSAGGARWEDRRHFMALAACAMRQILADHARAKRAAKRGGGGVTVTLVEGRVGARGLSVDPVDLDDALDRLSSIHERYARVVELRWFVGLSIEEAAEVLGVSRRTVELDWRAARVWLRSQLGVEGAE